MDAVQLWGYIVGGIGMLIGVAGWLRNSKGDSASQAAWMGTVNAKLDHISATIRQVEGITERTVLTEASVKSAHKRIDDHLRYDHQQQVGPRD